MRTLTLIVGALLAGWAGNGEGPPTANDAPTRTGAALVAPVSTGEITGTVTIGEPPRPVRDARVTLEGTSIGATTNRDGRFVLPDVPAGEHVLVTTLTGFGVARDTVQIADGETIEVTIDLTSRAVEIEDGRVTAQPKTEQARDRIARAVSVAQLRTAEAASVAWARRMVPRDSRLPLPPGNPDWNREQYDEIVENPFLATGRNPLSTFSIDVDRASYANVRRFLRDGQLPPTGAVRIEELVNYFDYSNPAPGPDEPPFRISTEVAPAPWQPLHHLVRIGLKAREVEMEDIPPSNLVFLLDVSGSMRSPDKLPLLKRSFELLVDQLRPEDRVAIVVYAGAAGSVLESTPGSEKEAIMDAIARLEAGGSTAGGAGIELAYRIAAENHIEGGNNRVILATDGDFNIGPSSDAAMVELIEEKREQGTFLTVLGFGTGNLQAAKMEKLADRGNGNWAYIDGLHEARKVLVGEMGGTLLTVAKDVKIQVEFNPAHVQAYRLIGYENRLLAAEDFADDTKDAGELGAGHTVTALYEVIPAGVESPVDVRGVDDLRYQTVDPKEVASETDELLYVKLRWKAPDADRSERIDHPILGTAVRQDASEDQRFAAAVAAWGMLLRDSEHVGDFTLERVAELAKTALGDDPEGYRAEFLSLVRESERVEEMVAMREEHDGRQERDGW